MLSEGETSQNNLRDSKPLAMLLMLVVKLNKFYFTRPVATFTVFRRIVEGYARKMTVIL